MLPRADATSARRPHRTGALPRHAAVSVLALAILLAGCETLVRGPGNRSRARTASTDSASVAPPTVAGTVATPFRQLAWPPGTAIVPFENLEGAILFDGRVVFHDRQASGKLLFDTGAGALALDYSVARRLGMRVEPVDTAALHYAHDVVDRVELGDLLLTRVTPVLTLDGSVARRVTDRDVIGLLGYSPLAERSVAIDYDEQLIAFPPRSLTPGDSPQSSPAGGDVVAMPAAGSPRARRSRDAHAGILGRSAVDIPFELSEDGKIVVEAVVEAGQGIEADAATLTLIVDTGATKSVFFRNALERRLPDWTSWRSLRGLAAPTLVGAAQARMVRVPSLAIVEDDPDVQLQDMDAAVIESPLEPLLSEAVGRHVHGLLGHSFLRHFRVLIDYPNRVLWLERKANPSERAWEYSQVGIQLERRRGAASVVAVVHGSPAAQAGIRPGDELVAIGGQPVQNLDLVTLARALEGPPGSSVTFTLRRGARERPYRLIRRQLL